MQQPLPTLQQTRTRSLRPITTTTTTTNTHLRSLVDPILHGSGEGLLLVVQVVVLYLALRPPHQLPRLDPLGGCWRFVLQVLVIQFALHICNIRNVMVQLLLT